MYIPLTFEGALQKCLYASGGFEQGFFTSGSDQYAYHLFKQNGKLEVFNGTLDNVEILVVGGGGGGAASSVYAAGGGGGGVTLLTNQRLYTGTYNITVGKGGAGAGASNNPGNSGIGSSFSGANISITANGGQGGNYGNLTSGGTSGNGFAGGLNQNGNSGGGGGASSVGQNATSLNGGNGGSGITASFGLYTNTYGCGGGGFVSDTADTPGSSCGGEYGMGGEANNPAEGGANYYGMGGGGGLSLGGNGGSGSVLIKYKINDYCKNWFNETGSCNCSTITFNITDQFNFYPDITGSYLYTQCGTNTLASGSLQAYYPITACAASNSVYWLQYTGSTPAGIVSGSTSGFASGNNCFSASYGVETCVTQSFPPICSGSFVFYKGGTSSQFYYVPTNSSSFEYSPISNNIVSFKCVSSGSFSDIGNYPYGITGAGAQLSISSSTFCTNYLFTPGSGTQTATYYECSTDTLVSIAISSPTRFCTRNGRPRTTFPNI